MENKLSLSNLDSRVGAEVVSYIWAHLTIPSMEVKKWLYPLAPRCILEVGFPTSTAPMICSRCGTIHGECLGGKVWDSCPACPTLPNHPEIPLAVIGIRANFTCYTFAEWPEAETAFILSEVYKNEHRGILQYSSESARERALYYSGDSGGL